MNYEKYINKLEYPAKPAKPAQPKLSGKDSASYLEYANAMKLYAEALANYESNDIVAFQKKKDEYNAEANRLAQLFKQDFLVEFQIEGHPKADLFFKICYDMGHANGLYEVISIAVDLIDLMKYNNNEIETLSNKLKS
jgi:hypothetical protein